MAIANVNSITINSTSRGGYGPFCGNTSITSVDLAYTPWTNNSMYNAFKGCSNLTSVTNINTNITNMTYTFGSCTNMRDAPILPNNVTDMYGTFHSCRNLVNAPTIPNSVTTLEAAFMYDYNLVNAPATIPSGVISMHQTFYACTNLVNIPPIPVNVINMYSTFDTCANLTNDVYIHSSSVDNARYCFTGTSASKNVYIPYNASLGIYTNTYNAFNTAGYNPSTTQHGVTIKENPYFILDSNNQFWYDTKYGVIHAIMNKVGDITIPNSINGTSIHAMSSSANFRNASQLTNINFNGVDILDFTNYCSWCTSLMHVYNWGQIGTNMQNAFYSCKNLLTIPNIPKGVINLATTFYGCENLTTTPVIPNSVTDMNFAFKSCKALTTFPNIPASVKYMSCTFETSNMVGNIYICSNQITCASYCFWATTTRINAYIPFTYSNGVYTKTYNAFISAGYDTNGTTSNVYLMNWTPT